MRRLSSLFTKILLFFLLNLLVLVLLVVGGVALRSRVDLHSFFGHRALDRLRVAAMFIERDLDARPKERWNAVLTEHAKIHRIDFGLVISGGAVFSSEGLRIPDAVIDKIAFMPLRKVSQRTDGDVQEGPRVDSWGGSPGKEAAWIEKRHGVRGHGNGFDGSRFLLKTRGPERYWVGLWFRLPVPEGSGEGPAMLLASSDSMTGHGFFFDPLPWILLVAGVLLVSVLLWIPMVRHITKPLGRMTRAAEAVAGGNFAVDIVVHRQDEIGRLSKAIAHMTERLRGVAEGQKRFLRDVAHELGSPIARIRLGLEVMEQRAAGENQCRLAAVGEDVAHLAELVNELLAFSRAEVRPEKVVPISVELLPVVRKCVHREGTGGADIVFDIDSAVTVMADPGLLSRAVANVVRNAVKYGADAGPITIKSKRHDDVVILSVSDAGPGVDPANIDRLFEPFFRPEDARTRETGGTGLGLSIVKTCVEACGGGVSAKNLTPRGFEVTLTFSAE